MNKKTINTLIISVTLLLFGSFTLYSFQREIQKPKLPVLGRVQPFSLQDSDGKTFGYDNLNGKVWVANFFFTTCSDICPMMSKNMANLSRSFDLVQNVALVSVTVNPENDSIQALKAYKEKFISGKKNWFFLTGKREEITDLVVNSFKLGSVDEPIFHSPKFTLVDRHGFIRGYYEGTEAEEINKLFKDAALLIKER